MTKGASIVSAKHIFKQDACRECELRLSTSGNIVQDYYEFVQKDDRTMRDLNRTLTIFHKKVRLEKLDMAEIELYSEAIIKSLEIREKEAKTRDVRSSDIHEINELNDLTCLLGGWDTVAARRSRAGTRSEARNSEVASNIPRSHTADGKVQNDPMCKVLFIPTESPLQMMIRQPIGAGWSR